jgi:hypothetical protein
MTVPDAMAGKLDDAPDEDRVAQEFAAHPVGEAEQPGIVLAAKIGEQGPAIRKSLSEGAEKSVFTACI